MLIGECVFYCGSVFVPGFVLGRLDLDGKYIYVFYCVGFFVMLWGFENVGCCSVLSWLNWSILM